MSGIAVVIAAYDEAERIGATIAALQALDGYGRIVVVDDGSRDETASIAESAGAKVIRLASNVGKGAALEHGLSRVEDADVVVLLDADLAETAAQAPSLVSPILGGVADMTIAAFPRPQKPAGFGLVKRLASWGISRLGDPSFVATAPLSGQRALSAECLAAVRPLESGYGVEVGLTIRALRARMRVLEVPTTMSHAATGRDVAGFVHRGRQFAHVALALLRIALSRRRR